MVARLTEAVPGGGLASLGGSLASWRWPSDRLSTDRAQIDSGHPGTGLRG
jgi:hypothetical protein